jgi:hypothetical protein
LPEVLGRARTAATALIAALLLALTAMPAVTDGVDPPDIETFMAALSSVESNGRYDALNASSGAMGKYQIMPANWRQWSLKYLGDADAAPTPAHQEAVARHKLTALYGWLGDWPSVAHWWLTGDGDTDPAHWSDFSRDYVNKVLTRMNNPALLARASAPAPKPAAPPSSEQVGPASATQVFDESDTRNIHFSGGWGAVEFARYAGGHARYAVDSGATAWFTFSGTAIAWIGPMGPTRGEAKVYVDEQLVATVDVYARFYRARAEVFSMTFDRPGTHTITIEVLGTPGRQVIALDEFVVTG